MKFLLRMRFRRTTLLTVFCGSLVVGVGMAPSYALPGAVLYVGLLVAVVAARRRGLAAAAGCMAFGLSIGLLRGAVFVRHQAEFAALYGQQITLTARALTDATYNTNKQFTFDAGDVTLPDERTLHGVISVSGSGENGVFEGDILEITGKLQPTLGAAQARMSYANFSLMEHQVSIISTVRRSFAAGLQNALPEPAGSFGLGLLTGQRSTLPDSTKLTLQMVGLTHVIAVSGYNMTIMLRASKRSFGRISKRLSLALSFTLMILFLMITGLSASIVRAAIVSGISLLATYYGREIKPLLLILAAAALTAYAKPYFVWSDAGWYLSFLAFGGVLIVSPLVAARVRGRWRESTLVAIGIESISAEIATLPYVLHTFGQMTAVGLLANVVVVAFIPFAMMACMVAGLAGIFMPVLCGWLAWPATLLLTYMLDTSTLLSRIPHVFHQNLYLTTAGMYCAYAAVIALAVALSFKHRLQSGILTDKNYLQPTAQSTSLAASLERMRIT
ncbi:MAG: hypothetical protein JWN38_856 [Candidatus Saccharibacteria bacterium]|nr:hypothetical protein [Candidatus Saccharibacteria bacterium]